MNKLEALEFIKEKCKKEGISAYKIGKAINKSAVGIQKILDGVVKNPNNKTISDILEFLESQQITNDYSVNNTQNFTNDLNTTYQSKTKEADLRELLACKRKSEKLLLEVVRLQSILRKNNIDFDDTFEL